MGLTSTPPSESLAVYVEENLKPIPEELERTPEAEHGVSTLFPQGKSMTFKLVGCPFVVQNVFIFFRSHHVTAPLIERHIEEAVHLTNIGGSTPVASSENHCFFPIFFKKCFFFLQGRADDATPVAGGTPVAGKDNIIDTDDENEPEGEESRTSLPSFQQ